MPADTDSDPLLDLPALLDPTIAIDPAALAFAYALYQELCCGSNPKAQQQAEKAWAALARPWSIRDDGALRLTGSRADCYIVSSGSCCVEGQFTTNRKTGRHSPKLCRGWLFGGCYHCAAFDIVRIAQYADRLLDRSSSAG